MSHQAVLQLLAIVMLICGVIIVAIDVATDLGFNPALRAKWSITWYLARYTAIICGFLLALDILTGAC